jgi:hypothetical protein
VRALFFFILFEWQKLEMDKTDDFLAFFHVLRGVSILPAYTFESICVADDRIVMKKERMARMPSAPLNPRLPPYLRAVAGRFSILNTSSDKTRSALSG